MPAIADWFDGFPYIVTRIGHTPLRHIALLPAGLPRERLLWLTRKQALANRLDTCLCLGPADAVFVAADGSEAGADSLPWGTPVAGMLPTAVLAAPTPELEARRLRLLRFVDQHRGSGYLVGDGLESRRVATAEELARLSGSSDAGVPKGLERCPACGTFRGECLLTTGDEAGAAETSVVLVHCRCENRNRCARCGATLAATRLSAYHYDETIGRVLYTAAYVGLGHSCSSAA